MGLFGDNSYSRFVAWSKIILPVASLAILSSLFLFSKSNDPSQGTPMTDAALKDFAAKERITEPRFAGMTPAGVAIQIAAKEASPRATGGPVFDATNLTAHIEMPSGATIDVEANQGSIDPLRELAELTGGITLETSLGYVAQTEGLRFALDRLDIQSAGKITATGPLGAVSAGGMHLMLDPASKDENAPGYLLVFKNGVKLVYQP